MATLGVVGIIHLSDFEGGQIIGRVFSVGTCATEGSVTADPAFGVGWRPHGPQCSRMNGVNVIQVAKLKF